LDLFRTRRWSRHRGQTFHHLLSFLLIAGTYLYARAQAAAQSYVAAGLVLAFALALPNLIWEWKHQWATFELLNNISHSHKNVVLSPLAYFLQQFLLIGPVTSAIWLIGLAMLLFQSD
jgi:hypothetical protein